MAAAGSKQCEHRVGGAGRGGEEQATLRNLGRQER